MNRRHFIQAGAASMLAGRLSLAHGALPFRARPLPRPSQLAWQRDEIALFLHFGVNTFTDREWGDGTEDPGVFAPTNLDARQWARAARASGARAMILTAKHHDGFCLWPTATTTHSVASSGWRGGAGDVVRDFVDAARAEGLRVGLYLSPWDRNASVYGDSPRYNDFYCAQLTELLTRYGRIAEVWFDGANGEGPNGRRQTYDWPRVFALVRRLQPGAVMFSDAGPDVRWCGNERGVAGDPNWSTVDPDAVPFPGATGPRVDDMLQHGDPAGTAWRPAEVDVSIRPGWFYHPAEDDTVRTADGLVELYFTSVGRNAKLLLNVPPTRAGLLHETDVTRLADARARREELFAHDLAASARRRWRANHTTAQLDLELPREASVSIARLEEPIERGQRVSAYRLLALVAGSWTELSRGTTIGHAKLDRFASVTTRRVRLAIDRATSAPLMIRLRVYSGLKR